MHGYFPPLREQHYAPNFRSLPCDISVLPCWVHVKFSSPFSINTIIGDPLTTVNVTMAHLTSLSVTFAPDSLSSIRVFDSFTFPVLTSLHMRAPDLSWRSPEHFYDQLRSLRMLNIIGPSEDLLKLLHHTPSLASLHVSTGGWIFVGLNPLLFGLTVADESDPIVPDLKRLIITAVLARWSATSESPPVRPLLKMVSSRTRYHTSVCPLEYLSIIHPHPEFLQEDFGRQLPALQCRKVERGRYEAFSGLVPREA